mmetsp:Transcript_1741/g.2115  ORF Transcript_1741/g.2115 Transcript_1741/m.2115 type:complete len:599 (+) Transcript_1741:129-1925(+)
MKILLFLRAENLPSGWRIKSPNSFAVISLVTGIGSVLGIKRRRFCITEIIPSTPSPEWITIPLVDHDAASGERIAIDIFQTKEEQHNAHTKEVHEKGYQGSEHRGAPNFSVHAQQVAGIVVSIDEILQDPNWTFIDPIRGYNGGKVIVHIEPEKGLVDSSHICFQLCGVSLCAKKKTFLDRAEQTDFIFEILCKFEGQTEEQWRLVYRSIKKKKSFKILWDTDSVSITTLCNQDLNRDLLIRIVEIDGTYRRNVLGWFHTNAHSMLASVCHDEKYSENFKPFLVSKDDGKSLGQIIVTQAFIKKSCHSSDQSRSFPLSSDQIVASCGPIQILPPPTSHAVPTTIPPFKTSSFKAYKRNCSIDLCIAVDFTIGNADFTSPDSPHYQSRSGELNNYEWTIKIVGESLQGLSKTQEFPIWGFGGCFDNKTVPIFQCGFLPKAKGTEGLLASYAQTFKTGVKPGNCNCGLDSIIMAAAHHAEKELDAARHCQSLSYTLLVILTVYDGSKIKLEKKKKIASIASAPISILTLKIPIPCVSTVLSIDKELKTYSSNNNCRNFCSYIDGTNIITERKSSQLSTKIHNLIEDQMPFYFESNGIFPY